MFHCLVIKVCCVCLSDNLFILSHSQLLVKNFFNFFRSFQLLKKLKRRRRDLNPRAALTTYSLSRGAPSASLGTSPNCPTQSLLIFSEAFYIISRCFSFVKNFFHLFSFSTAERVGFEPTRPCGQTVFKTASL